MDFDVQDNAVVPESNFTVNATVLGSAITNGPNGYNLPVTCCFNLGNYTYNPWGNYNNASEGNINDGKNPRFWKSPISFKAGTPINIAACSWVKQNNRWSKSITVDTSSNPSNLIVLKNGDSVPNIPGFNNQVSIKDIVTDYIENGRIKLKENEAIYLFELGTKKLNDKAADFQDLVILVSINGVDTSQSEDESQDAVSPNEYSNEIPHKTVTKLVIEHRGGDTINFKSPEETKVILYIGNKQHYLNFTELGVFKSGDRAILIPEEYGNKKLNVSQGDPLSIKIVDVPSKSLIYSRNITPK
ncbi:MAG: hypothetical protein WBL13_09305 [Methanosarcina flavescens]